METQTALSVRRSILRPSRQKYKAASSDKQPIRQRQPRTPSSESGAPRNRTVRHAKSSIRNTASAPAPFRRHLCHAYTTTQSKYHGHRWRRVDNVAHSAVQPPRGPHTLLLSFFQDPTFGQPLQRTGLSDSSQEGKPRRQKALRTKGIPRWYLSMIVIPVLHTRMRPALG